MVKVKKEEGNFSVANNSINSANSVSVGGKKVDDEVIEIPIGKWFGFFKTDGWRSLSIVLGIAVVILLFLMITGRGVGGGGGVSENVAGENLVKFINAQGQGSASVVGVVKKDGFYEVTVNYNGQQVPVLVTLDGKNLVSGTIPLSGGVNTVTGNVVADTGDTANEPAPSVKADVSADDDAVLGSKDAKVTIIEFSDYQCPFCRKFWSDTYAQLKKDYIDTGKVKLVYRDYPLSFHPMALPSAIAAECAREKGKDAGYYKMHDKIFEEQNKLDGGTVRSTVQYTNDDLKKWAKEIGYDIGSCLDSQKYKDEVNKDFQDGNSAGVSGTPAFFVNGKLLSGAQPYSAFKQAIEAELGV